MRSKEPTQDGLVIELLPAGNFKVELRSGQVIRCHLSGKMRLYKIKVLAGDRVQCIVSGEIGRILRRY